MKKPKINAFDIVILFIVLILIFAASVKFRNYNASNEDTASVNKIEYLIRMDNVRKYTADAFEIGDKVYDSQTNVLIGNIIDKKIEQNVSYEKLESGKLVKSKIPNRFDLILALQTEGTVTQEGYYANRSVELKVGSDKQIETLYAKTTGKITSIKVSGD